MIFKYKEAKERNVGNNMKIKDLYSGKNMPIDFVIGKLNGFHGTFKNTKSIKYYFIIDGKAKVKINDELNEVEKGDFVLIPINAEHSIKGDVEFAIMCMPSFDIDKEQIV